MKKQCKTHTGIILKDEITETPFGNITEFYEEFESQCKNCKRKFGYQLWSTFSKKELIIRQFHNETLQFTKSIHKTLTNILKFCECKKHQIENCQICFKEIIKEEENKE